MKIRIFLMTIFLLSFTSFYSYATELVLPTNASNTIIFKEPLSASFTADQLFDRMEAKSESIEAIEANVCLFDKTSTASVVLRVKSPNKFCINFLDGSSSIFFNGSKIWIYIKSLNECFYQSYESSSWWEQYTGVFISFINPKKLFVNMTRNSLKAIFEIESIKREKTSDDYYYYLKFTPKFKDIFIQVFELGYYEAVFSEKIYLPVKVIEYGTDGKLKNTLIVNSYKMNEDVPDENFEYKNTTEAVLVPINVVILQKIEDYKEKLLKKLDEAKESVTNKLFNWGF